MDLNVEYKNNSTILLKSWNYFVVSEYEQSFESSVDTPVALI